MRTCQLLDTWGDDRELTATEGSAGGRAPWTHPEALRPGRDATVSDPTDL